MQQIHKIIASLIPEHDGRTRSRNSSVPEHSLPEEDMMFVSLLYNDILALEAEESVKERERARGSLQSVTKPNKTCQSLIKASQFV